MGTRKPRPMGKIRGSSMKKITWIKYTHANGQVIYSGKLSADEKRVNESKYGKIISKEIQ